MIPPTLAAQMAAAYQRITRGRLPLNVVTSGDSAEQHRFGDHLDHDRRYARTDEFLSVVRGVWGGRPYDFDGVRNRVEGGLTALPPDPVPRLSFGGSSAARRRPVRSRPGHTDAHLTWGEPPAQVKRHRPRRQPCRGREPDRRVHVLGVEHFVLSGYPHLEQAYWFGEGVIPELAALGLPAGAVSTAAGALLAVGGR